MATLFWRGDVPAVSQVTTVTITAWDVLTTYSVTINGKSVSVIGDTSAAQTASDLQVALAASTIAEFQEITWTYPGSGAVVTGTASTAGVPFTLTTSVSGGTGTISNSTTTTSAGPNDVSLAANYSTGSLPTNGDTLWFINSTSPALYNLSALSSVTLAALYIDSTYTAQIGVPRYNATGGYLEYRPQYFAVGATAFTMVAGAGSGPGRVKINFGSVQTTASIDMTGSAIDAGLPCVILQGTHASNALNVQQGTVGVAIDPGSVSTLATVQTGYQISQQTDVTLTLGLGCTLTTLNLYGGIVNINSSATTVKAYGSTLNVYAAAAITTLDIQEQGTVNWESSGTLTTGTVGAGSTLDFSKDPRAKTVTNLTVYGTLTDDSKVVTYTNPVSFPNGIGDSGATLNWGSNFSLARS